MKFLHLAARVIFVLSLPLLFLSLSLAIAFNSPWLYHYGFEKYDVESVTGIERSELDYAAGQLIAYFNSDEELIDVVVTKDGEPFELFNEREILHLVDVKNLVQLDYAVLLATGLYSLGYCAVFLARRTREWFNLARSIICGGMLTFLIIGVAAFIALIDFNWFFLQFHLISFANDLWILDPATDYLIMMFPQGFWFDATILCAVMTLLWAAIFWGASYAALYTADIRR